MGEISIKKLNKVAVAEFANFIQEPNVFYYLNYNYDPDVDQLNQFIKNHAYDLYVGVLYDHSLNEYVPMSCFYSSNIDLNALKQCLINFKHIKIFIQELKAGYSNAFVFPFTFLVKKFIEKEYFPKNILDENLSPRPVFTTMPNNNSSSVSTISSSDANLSPETPSAIVSNGPIVAPDNNIAQSESIVAPANVMPPASVEPSENAFENRPPPLLKMASNLMFALKEWARSGFKVVPRTVFEQRLAICSTCDRWDPNGFNGTGQCLECGCSAAKHWLASSECPLKKWGTYGDVQDELKQEISITDILSKSNEIYSSFDSNSKIVQLLNKYNAELNVPGGCSGCKSKRLKMWLYKELEALPSIEKTALINIINKN